MVHPGNAILVIVGDVDPVATIAKVKALYGDIPNHPVPAHPAVNLTPVKPETFTLDSNLPYVLGFIAYRLPGTDSPDYAASPDAVRHPGQPAGRPLWHGAGGQGALCRVRPRRNLS